MPADPDKRRGIPRPEHEDGSQRQGGTGQRQDNRATPPGHEIPRGPDEDDGDPPPSPDREENQPG